MALDVNISALLTEDCTYYPKSGVDKHGQETWGAGVTLKCFPAAGSTGGAGARQITKPDGTIYISTMSLSFDANNTTVQGFQLGDKFTSPGIAGGQTLEAREISTSYSPGPSLGEAMAAWLVEVSL